MDIKILTDVTKQNIMQDLEIIVEALQKAVKFEVFNKMELKSIQLSLEALTKELQPKEEEVKPKMEISK